MKSKRVSVTQTEIEHGVQADCTLCPWSLALQKAFPELQWSVTGHFAYYSSDELAERTLGSFELPGAVKAWIRAFDAGLEVQPFSFMLPLYEKINV